MKPEQFTATLDIHIPIAEVEPFRKAIDAINDIASALLATGNKDMLEVSWQLADELAKLKDLRDALYF